LSRAPVTVRPFEDNYGNWWNTGTPWIGYNWTFERRIDLLPGRIFPDGQMSFSSCFADFPHWVPNHKITDPEELFTGWMLLSYRKPASASSTLADFSASRITDENPRTFWVAAANRPGETITVDLERADEVRAIQVNFADYKSGGLRTRPTSIPNSRSRGRSTARTGRRPRTPSPRGETVRMPTSSFAAGARPVHLHIHEHVVRLTLATSDIRVFRTPMDRAKMPSSVTASRHQISEMRRPVGQKSPGRRLQYPPRYSPDRLTQNIPALG
jgi:hypothetical protein